MYLWRGLSYNPCKCWEATVYYLIENLMNICRSSVVKGKEKRSDKQSPTLREERWMMFTRIRHDQIYMWCILISSLLHYE